MRTHVRTRARRNGGWHSLSAAWSAPRHRIHARPLEHGFLGGPRWRDPYYCEWAVVVGDRIRRLPKGRDLTLAGLAALVEKPEGGRYTAGDFSRLDRGWASSPLYVYLAVAEVLEVEPERLLGPDDAQRSVTEAELTLVRFLRAVALVGSFAVMLATIAFAHGVGPKSLAAVLGTAASLLLTAALAVAFTGLASLTGFSSEEATLLGATAGQVSLEGLVLAGMVIGALGVLDDVTVSQASTVLALRHANPGQGFRELYRRALGVGRDHVTATVNTLVLAYVGASLPVLLIFSVGGVPFACRSRTRSTARRSPSRSSPRS